MAAALVWISINFLKKYQSLEMKNHLIFISLISFIKAEERLSWFTTDPELKRSIFVPDRLSEGKEENRILPWVFHDDEQEKIMELKCIMI